jgi:sugar (pentulose or hexulose) kinase
MSLLGVDLGTSAIKVAAYDNDGTQLASASQSVAAHRPEPGQWEVDVLESRAAFESTLRAVAAHPAVRRDPPVALACSSSGREVFPVSAHGTPLGRCLMTADTRGDDVAELVASQRSAEDWFAVAGHVPRRMDPVVRALWWRQNDPAVAARTRWFMNWHEYYSLLLTGHAVVDRSDAGTWATYDLATGEWAADRVAETGLDPAWLPEIRSSGTPIGTILPSVARSLGLPSDICVVTGAYDAFGAAIGAAAVDPGVIGLACGTWHSYTMAIQRGWPAALHEAGISVFPHPGPSGYGILVTDPNGMSVIDWARALLGMSIPELDAGLAALGPDPGRVVAAPTFTPLPHRSGASGGGWIGGLDLSTTGLDLVRALLEGIALAFADSVEILRDLGLEATLVRATGGGARSAWWLQLHADVAGLPVEVVEQDEPGAFGAAILAGVGAGVHADVSTAAARLVRVARRYEPDATRGSRYAERRTQLAHDTGVA